MTAVCESTSLIIFGASGDLTQRMLMPSLFNLCRKDRLSGKWQIVGHSHTSGGQFHAFLYSDGVMKDLGTLGGTTSTAYGINDSSQIVGDARTAEASLHAFLYTGGVMHDLGTLGGTASNGYGINELGQIVGWSYTAAAADHAFLCTTYGGPAPISLLLLD